MPSGSSKNYREAYGLHASNGILFNHESPRRGESFVTRKITLAAARIKHGLQDKLVLEQSGGQARLGLRPRIRRCHVADVAAGGAGRFCDRATGEKRTAWASSWSETFALIGLDWRKHVVTDDDYLRPTEVDLLIGDPSKAKAKLGWESEDQGSRIW